MSTVQRLLVLISLLCSLGCIREKPAPAVRERHPQQSQWAHAPLFARPLPSETAAYTRIVRLPRRADQPQNVFVPLSFEPMFTAIRNGQRLIREHTVLADAWRGRDVQHMAAEAFGTTYPFLATRGVELAAWSGDDQAVVVNPDVVGTEAGTERSLGIGLYHEATHAVFFRLLLAYCAYTPEEWAAINRNCTDVNYEYAFVQETLAHMNEERWLNRDENEGELTANRELYQFIAGARRHSQPSQFAAWMERYTLRTHSLTATCGPPVILRGPHRGEYCLPAVIAADDTVLMVVNSRP